MTSEIDANGYYVTQKHTHVTLRFLGIDSFRTDGFNHQNVVMDLDIKHVLSTDQSEYFAVEIFPSYGASVSFTCTAIEVAEVLAVPRA